MNIRPLGNRVIVKKVAAPTQTPGGVLLPDQAQDERNEGVVVAVGPGRHLENGTVAPVQIAVGATVIFQPYKGTEVKIGSDMFTVLMAEDIIGEKVG